MYNRSNTYGSLLFIVPYSFFLIMQVAIIVLINTNEYLFFFHQAVVDSIQLYQEMKTNAQMVHGQVFDGSL